MKRKATFILVLAGLAGVWIIAAPFLATLLIVERPLGQADAIIVLSGSAAYKERTKKATELYKNGVAPKIFITNDGERAGWSNADQGNPPFVELEQRELIANGVSPDAIVVLPGIVSGTDQEAKALAAEIESHPVGSVLIVTSAYHTRRSLWTFERLLAGKNVEVGIEHAPLGDGSPKSSSWWLRPRGWTTIGGEYVKFAVYWVFY